MGHVPPPPPPRTSTPDDISLTGLVLKGNTSWLRAFFNGTFWQGKLERPDWSHVKTALLRKDMEMLRLVAAYYEGTPTQTDLAELRRDTGDQYPHHLKRLRRCGVKLPPDAPDVTALPEPAPVQAVKTETDPFEIMYKKIPRDWIEFLQTLKDNGAPEAVIAGDALRDLLNDKPVGMVHIFVKDRGSEKKNKAFFEKTFKIPAPQALKSFFGGNEQSGLKSASAQKYGIISKTMFYDVIFINGNTKAPSDPDHTFFAIDIVASFELSINRVACTADRIITTPAYLESVARKKITSWKNTSKDSLQLTIQKYPDWELCENSKKLLASPPPPRPPFPPGRTVRL